MKAQDRNPENPKPENTGASPAHAGTGLLALGFMGPTPEPASSKSASSKSASAQPPAPAETPKTWAWSQTAEKFRQELENPGTPAGALYKQYMEADHDRIGAFGTWQLYQLSMAMTLALDRAAPPETAFVINSSTGKDSTLAAQAVLAAVGQELKAGRPWARKIVVAIADTGSEFPEMAARMRSEAVALNALGQKWAIPLSAIVVKPQAKHRLLVELCGNGKPLPPVNKKGKAEGVSSWCMDRVKAGTLNKIARQMSQECGDYIAILGTRSAESARRKDSVARHSSGLPLGLSRIARGPGWGLAFTPVTMWPNTDVSDFLRAFPSPWRPEGRQELREIYYKGSPLEDSPEHEPGECAVTISSEGVVSNSCSDLSGTRYGCWHCFLSENKSLKNTSRREPKYAWLRKFHAYLRIKAKGAIARSSKLKAMGFTRADSFTKTFTFLERYKMLMLLYRAEAESGLQLLEKEDEQAIAALWKKHGAFTVSPEDARDDARAWKKTGRWRAFFEGIEDEAWRLCNALSEGIPMGALCGMAASDRDGPGFQLEAAEKKGRGGREQPLELSHLLAITGQGFGSPPYPKILAYVYREKREGHAHKIITAITDTPSLLGLPTNTGLLNGSSGSRWDALGIRQPLPWELEAAEDRNFVYSIDPELPVAETALRSCPSESRAEWAYQIGVLSSGCGTDDALKDAWFDAQLIGGLRPADKETLKAAVLLCAELAASSDALTGHFGARRRACLREIAPYRDLILEDSPRGKEAARKTREIVRRTLQVAEAREEMEHYAKLMKLAARGIQTGTLNASLILKLCYIAHLDAVDPPEAEKSMMELLRVWPRTEPAPPPAAHALAA